MGQQTLFATLRRELLLQDWYGSLTNNILATLQRVTTLHVSHDTWFATFRKVLLVQEQYGSSTNKTLAMLQRVIDLCEL